MKNNEIKDLKDLTIDELTQKEQKLREELFNLKFQHATGHLDNTMRLTQVKKSIAKVLTLANAKKKAN